MLRKILLGFAILVFLLAAAGIFLYIKLRPSIQAAEARAIEEQKILRPRLIKGEGHFEKRTFYIGEGLGNISQIRVGWPADREGADIAVVGSQGADFIDTAARKKKEVRFSIQQRCPVQVARMSSSGEYGYLTRDESWAVPATLFDKEGHVSWRSEKWPGVNDSVSGDVFGDGRLSVVIGYNGGGGLVLLDSQGQTLWKKEERNVWHVETLDTNGDGHDEILNSNTKGQLCVRNADGDELRQYLPGSSVSWFAPTRWGNETRPTHILVSTTEVQAGCCKPVFLVLDANGSVVAKRESPLGDLLNRMAATPVSFGKKPESEYFAVLRNNFARDRSMLLLYDRDGQIAYQEILAETCLGMNALPGVDTGRLLVGCASKIWEYFPVPQDDGTRKMSRPRSH